MAAKSTSMLVITTETVIVERFSTTSSGVGGAVRYVHSCPAKLLAVCTISITCCPNGPRLTVYSTPSGLEASCAVILWLKLKSTNADAGLSST
ncbi:hypothetical protein DQ04_01481160 [Trypanosoma grayi]|uniref:hypothetical protein n=1 Tax=Trypanosoma grayi TaxID=71804 RepID=UPI0004F45095|nr:hypothetical protein DQ04_01481160 [Trypanosoma grayi]KEG12713.1 hypothetical protein DQ04_01481160 [Trypanosoma grayi]